MNLYQIIKSLQNAQGSNAKRDILEANKNNELLKAYLKATYDPAISYYQKKVPKHGAPAARQVSFDMSDIQHAKWAFADRNVTGDAAKRAMVKWLEDQVSVEDQELCRLMIERSVGAGIGDTMILDTWPDLYFIPPYQRCSLMDEKIKAKFAALPFSFVQTKLDGTFCYLEKSLERTRAITRSGNLYPQWFADRFAGGFDNGVLVGELEVYTQDFKLLDRKTGNGILNSVLQGADESDFAQYNFMHTSWDWLTSEEFKSGKSSRKYDYRLGNLITMLQNAPIYLSVVGNWKVTSIEDAYKIYSQHTTKGLEGCVIKDPNSLWKDGTAKDIVKLKVKFEADFEVIGVAEGTGKYVGMMGALTIATSDRKLVCDLGTGFTDNDRQDWWLNSHEWIGKIVTVSANDVISKRTDNIKSLFLPAFEMLRTDKTEADSLERVMEQLNAAKNGC